jgi:hypothetical protein
MAEIRDGDAYSITIADDARPCIVFPAGLFDKTQCPKDAKALAAAPGVNPDSRVLALGSVLPDDTFATVVVTATQLADNAEPSDLHEFARGMADGLVKSRHAATLRSGPEVQSVMLGGVHAARITFDVSGLSEHGLDHVVSYASWSKTSDYTFTLMTAPDHAAVIDALADRIDSATASGASRCRSSARCSSPPSSGRSSSDARRPRRPRRERQGRRAERATGPRTCAVAFEHAHSSPRGRNRGLAGLAGAGPLGGRLQQ